jgi:putative PIN family toxin of toxin-antitoxin system
VKIVFDTNVLLAAMFTRGVCEALLDICLGSELHQVFISEPILKEFVEKAVEKFDAPDEKLQRAIKIFREQMTLVEAVKVAKSACRDPDDLVVLGTLLAAQADVLVTGDKDLLTLVEFEGRPIITPRQCFVRVI